MKKTSIGGQALIEGVMMRGPSKISMVVRKPNKDLEKNVQIIDLPSKKYKILQTPFIRGVVALIESMYVGISALMFSASFWDDQEEEMSSGETIGVILSSLLIAVGIFVVFPNFLTSLIQPFVSSVFVLNLIEGLIRIAIFLAYIVAISKMDDLYRVFQYHGAEHKTINAYEAGEDLTVENVRKHSIMHKRCGTSFLFMVMMVSVVVFSFFGWPSPLMRIVTRVLALPLIAGISYEINKLMGRMDNPIANTLAKPGLMIQNFATVKEPDDSMIEVAIVALEDVLPSEGEDDSW